MLHKAFDEHEVRRRAARMRIDIIEMLATAGSGHPGGSLSSADIVATLFFGGVLNYNPRNPDDPSRDRFILSKGHAAPVLYAALGEAGIIDKEEYWGLRKLGRMLQGHPDALKTPGVEVSTGSLGQGLSIACGMAKGLQLDGGSQRVYCLLGDGELQEGEVWEAAMFAAHHKIDNLIAVVDLNGLQIDGRTDDVMSVCDVGEKFRAFGWDVHEVAGHDVSCLSEMFCLPPVCSKPRVIIAHTVKGKDVSFMENKANWHGNAPSAEQAIEACSDIRACVGGEL